MHSQLLTTKFGFCSGNHIYGIYIMKQLQEIPNRKLYTCYADLKATYNYINTSQMNQPTEDSDLAFPSDANVLMMIRWSMLMT